MPALQELRELAPDDPSLLNELLETFHSETSKLLADLPQAVLENDFNTAHRLIHTIKGSAATFGLTKLHALALDIETQIKSDAPPPSASLAPQIDLLKEQFALSYQLLETSI